MIVPNAGERFVERAQRIYPDSIYLQNRWMLAVLWLRNKSRIGYAIDKLSPIDKKPPVLNQPPLPIMQTVIQLPDEQVIPGVVNFRSKR